MFVSFVNTKCQVTRYFAFPLLNGMSTTTRAYSIIYPISKTMITIAIVKYNNTIVIKIPFLHETVFTQKNHRAPDEIFI